MRWVAKVVDKFTPRKTAATWRSVNVGELSEGDLGKVTGGEIVVTKYLDTSSTKLFLEVMSSRNWGGPAFVARD
jgi:type VI protein secretion system component Hcp